MASQDEDGGATRRIATLRRHFAESGVADLASPVSRSEARLRSAPRLARTLTAAQALQTFASADLLRARFAELLPAEQARFMPALLLASPFPQPSDAEAGEAESAAPHAGRQGVGQREGVAGGGRHARHPGAALGDQPA